jgi:hypothetical protein
MAGEETLQGGIGLGRVRLPRTRLSGYSRHLAKITDLIEADHPSVSDTGDLFPSDAEIAVRVKALEGDDAEHLAAPREAPRQLKVDLFTCCFDNGARIVSPESG